MALSNKVRFWLAGWNWGLQGAPCHPALGIHWTSGWNAAQQFKEDVQSLRLQQEDCNAS